MCAIKKVYISCCNNYNKTWFIYWLNYIEMIKLKWGKQKKMLVQHTYSTDNELTE